MTQSDSIDGISVKTALVVNIAPMHRMYDNGILTGPCWTASNIALIQSQTLQFLSIIGNEPTSPVTWSLRANQG